jgi:hypothetical protein
LKVSPHALNKAFEGLGYYRIGRAKSFFQENASQPWVWNRDKNEDIYNYGKAQGYDN